MAGKLVQVANTTLTGAVSAIDLSGSITDNNVYQLVYTNIQPSTDAQNFVFRVTKTSDNSADSTSNYDRTGKTLKANTTFGDTNQTDLNRWQVDKGGTASGETLSGTMMLYNFYDSNLYSMTTVRATGRIDDGTNQGFNGSFWHTVAQSNNGLYIYFTTGNIASGTIAIYKVLP